MLKSTDMGQAEVLSPSTDQEVHRSLGTMLVLKRQPAWQEATPDAQRPFDLDNLAVLKRWERRLGGRIYRVYDYAHEAEWEFFALLEFDNLDAWQSLQQYLETSGFGAYYVWDIVALGRRLG